MQALGSLLHFRFSGVRLPDGVRDILLDGGADGLGLLIGVALSVLERPGNRLGAVRHFGGDGVGSLLYFRLEVFLHGPRVGLALVVFGHFGPEPVDVRLDIGLFGVRLA